MSVRARLVGAESGLSGFGSHPVTSVRIIVATFQLQSSVMSFHSQVLYVCEFL